MSLVIQYGFASPPRQTTPSNVNSGVIFKVVHGNDKHGLYVEVFVSTLINMSYNYGVVLVSFQYSMCS